MPPEVIALQSKRVVAVQFVGLDPDQQDEINAAIDERLMKCGSDVAAAVEIQKEKDVKVEKQSLYFAEWERLEQVMAEAEAIAAEA